MPGTRLTPQSIEIKWHKMSSALLRFQEKQGEACGGVSRAGAGTWNNIFGVGAGEEKEMSSQRAGSSTVVAGQAGL